MSDPTLNILILTAIGSVAAIFLINIYPRSTGTLLSAIPLLLFIFFGPLFLHGKNYIDKLLEYTQSIFYWHWPIMLGALLAAMGIRKLVNGQSERARIIFYALSWILCAIIATVAYTYLLDAPAYFLYFCLIITLPFFVSGINLASWHHIKKTPIAQAGNIH